jgi:hypothetical protein
MSNKENVIFTAIILSRRKFRSFCKIGLYEFIQSSRQFGVPVTLLAHIQ